MMKSLIMKKDEMTEEIKSVRKEENIAND